jgi:hypothetical protein
LAKEGKTGEKKSNLLATAAPATKSFVQCTTSDEDFHQVHTIPWSTMAGAHSDVEPHKSLQQFIEDFKKRLLHELPAGRRYDCDSPKDFLSYLDSCLTMPFVSDDLIWGSEEADGEEIPKNGNRSFKSVGLAMSMVQDRSCLSIW